MRTMNSTGWGILVMWAVLILLFIMTLTACYPDPREEVQKFDGLIEGDIHCIMTQFDSPRVWLCQHQPSGRTFTCSADIQGSANCIEGSVKLGGYQ